MKYFILFIIMGFLLFLTSYSGCTKIDIPVKEEDAEELQIKAEYMEILDTQPLIVSVANSKLDIVWNSKIESDINSSGYFTPTNGNRVVYVPPDIEENCSVRIVATEFDKLQNNTREAYIDIKVMDEGRPPEAGDILLNEIAWAGTLKSSYDEYVELVNRTNRTFYLNNWSIKNAAGSGKSLVFSGLIKPKGVFLITNYVDSDKSSIVRNPDYSVSAVAFSNSKFGPFILMDDEGNIFDTVGDGRDYIYGINTKDTRASMARYTQSTTYDWDESSWYTEGRSINFSDETFGTPGEINSNVSYGSAEIEGSAEGMITEFYIDAKDEIGEDWVEILITRSGNIKNFMITDLDGDDSLITNGDSVELEKGSYILVVWGDEFNMDDNVFTVPDTNPTGTKDELVLLNSGRFMDALCYYSTDDVQFDDEEKIKEYGWEGDPVKSKYGSRRMMSDGNYDPSLSSGAWDVESEPVHHF